MINMKKAIIFALIFAITAAFTGCNMKNEDMIIGDRSDISPISKDGAEVSVLNVTPSSLTVKIKNNTDSFWQSGNYREYSLEYKLGGEWYKVTQTGETANTMELVIFAPGEELTHTFDLENRYGKLNTGTYRLIKSYWANRTDSEDAHAFYITIEFDIT